ncbi:hypothetical protein OOZ19_17380 [Saccharopolyspora sp. NFXS83]|uniref:hypothetical protein n=1 Tax=Saccharopolyspora sp. NFXS83 TaxID=2993560 RepID=UPI00224B2545|nr:hypothetical protein [Saccharopolyspora sp. NFXS83]MCX2732014.1 hypothetical protein [Saccharopolyspora sp. NFXS83]
MGERADRWSTIPVRRRVLGVVRTLTALDRLHDVFAVLADDFRVETRFAVAAGSEFEADLQGHLDAARMRSLPWRDATKDHVDLAISPSSNGALHELDVPVLTLPHGAGYHKLRPTDSGVANDISGLSAEQLLHDGRVVPSVLALSHRNQLELLRSSCPDAAERAVVVGDPCFARLRASLPMREQYRAEFGLDGRRLVVVSSTWGGGSLFAEWPELASSLVDELPDSRVALVLHPNVWSKHSAWQVGQWTRRARRSGLVVVPPHRGWRAALVAADTVVADHGSLALYAAALGKPLLLGAFAEPELAPGTPIAHLGTHVPRLRPVNLMSQVDGALPVPDHESLAARAFLRPAEAVARLREAVYAQLDLSPPAFPAVPEPVSPFTPSPI